MRGEQEAVWAELIALGKRVREEPILSQAEAVARETMQHARRNVETLTNRLRLMGYQFADPARAYLPPKPGSDLLLAGIEQAAGILPLSLRAWYEVVGEVSFMGSYPGLASFADSMHGMTTPQLLTDPLVVFPIEGVLEEFRRQVQDYEREPNEPFYFPVAPDEYHKANLGGESAYEIAIPNPGADAYLENSPGGLTFIDYLRKSFHWGGFPGLAVQPNPPTALLAQLTEGLELI
jgi:hypothetical protein